MLPKSKFNFQNAKGLGLRQGIEGRAGRPNQRIGTGSVLLCRGLCGALAPEGTDQATVGRRR